MTVEDKEEAQTTKEEVGSPPEEWSPDLHWLTEQLALGAHFPIQCASRLAAEPFGISAVVDLRAEACDDEEALRGAGIEFLHLPTPDLQPASYAHLERGVDFVRERLGRGKKVLIHCQHGIGRSALLALCVLVDQGWQPLTALAHAKDRRSVVSPSQSQYDGWAGWLRARRLPVPDYHSFGLIAYRHLAQR